MIEALREIGMVCGKDSLVDNPFFGKKSEACKVINICLKEEQGNYGFLEVRLEDFDEGNYMKYLYKRKGANGPNYTPCGVLTDKIEKTIKGRIYSWFNKDEKFISIQKILDLYKEKIIEGIENINIDNKKHYLLTITINNRYLADYDMFKEEMIKRLSEKQYEIYTKEGICSLCSFEGEVFGNIAPFSSYNLKRQCYIAGGFNKSQGWKNFPICISCSNYLNQGKKIMEEHLNFRLGGSFYYLLPKAIIDYEAHLPEIMNIYKNYEDKKIDTKKLKKISGEEEQDILALMKDENDFFLLDFLFYEKIQEKFMIHLFLEGVYPSRLAELFKSKEKAEDYEYLKDVTFSKKLPPKNVEFNFFILRSFTISTDQFLNLTEKIFKKILIDKGFITNLLIQKIRDSFRKEEYYELNVLKAQVVLNFLLELGLITNKPEVKDLAEIVIKNELSEKIEEFFSKNQSTFYNSQTRVSFLLGVLTKKLLNIQHQERGSSPFLKQLKNLTMNERDIKALYPKIINKLQEYDKNYYQQLEEVISGYFTLSGNNWDLSVDEVNYYFVLGLTLHKLDIFTNQKEEQNDTGK